MKQQLVIEILGKEFFDLDEGGRRKKLEDGVVEGLAREMGDLRAEEERRKGVGKDGEVCVGVIIMPEDVREFAVKSRELRCIGLLRERSGKREVRGCVMVGSERGDAYEISEMYVEPRWRGKGWGGRLLEEVVRRVREECKEREVRIGLGVAGDNERAEAFYRRHGFEVREKRMRWRGGEVQAR